MNNIPSSKQNLNLLTRGLLALNLQREIKEGAYTAINRITKDRGVIQRRQQYSSELERVLKETRLTNALLSEVSKSTTSPEGYYPEDLIQYYNGVFLNQVHQLKDKLLRLIDRLLIVPEDVEDSLKKDPKEVKYLKFISKYEQKLKEIGISELVKVWGKGSINVVLQRRTQHHHFVSRLPLNDSFQKIQMSRMMLSSTASHVLSDYGVTRMQELGEESFETFNKETIRKHEETFKLIEENIDSIAEKLIFHFKIPTNPEDVASIVNAYTTFLSSEEIKNEATKRKIDKDIQEILDTFIRFNSEFLGEKLVSTYLVGSCGRGEYIPGSSDINVIVVTNDKRLNKIVRDVTPPMDITFVDEESLVTDEFKKERFIIWSDGILLQGKNIKINEDDFPKPGTLLALLLNRNFVDKIKELKLKIESLNNPTNSLLRAYTLKVVKLIMNFDFGVAMSNQPFYSSSRSKRIAHTKAVFPTEKRIDTLEEIYQSGAVDKDDLIMVIETIIENAEKNYKKMEAVEAEVIND